MTQIYVEVEDNPNCGYSPQQAFQVLGPPCQAPAVLIHEIGARPGPHVVVGWSSKDGGTPCPVTCVKVTDSGAGVSLLISGGDYGIRLRPAADHGPWDLGDARQWGEPYMLLDPAIRVEAMP
ncbi:MAG: hypothetical protein HY682_01055 [Chloroflexi bacterium]|nr:hypothetical protein [Chloroflexota bacterium]